MIKILKGINRYSNEDLIASFDYFEKDKCVGFCDLNIVDNNTLMITNLMIRGEYRNQGYGTKMIAELVQLYKEQFIDSYPRLILRVLPYNTPALKIYLKNGFEIYNVEETFSDEYMLRMELRK